MIYRVAGAIFFILFAVNGLVGDKVPVAIVAVVALVAGIALIAGV